MRGLLAGWYILLYHDVSWEESPFTRHIGGTCPPDVFREHVRVCSELGQLVSVREGMEKLKGGEAAAPFFSFWFDDGFAGVRKYAAPILAERGVTAATSVCSRFANRTEMFWRFKLSYLQSLDAGRHLQARLRRHGYARSDLIRQFSLNRFSDEVLSIIAALYDEAANRCVQEDAFRIFDTPAGLAELHDRGWVIANHSAAHYPIGEKHLCEMLVDQFQECERFIQDLIGTASEFWVSPFAHEIAPTDLQTGHDPSCKPTIVLAGDRINMCPDIDSTRTLYRIVAPANDRSRLADAVFSASRQSLQ